MDPLLLAALNFGTGILTGGIVAVIAQRIAFDHATKLAGAQVARERAGRLLALRREIDENLVRLGDGTTRPFPERIERTAWDAARSLDFPKTALEALLGAYAAGVHANDRIELVNRNLTATGGAIDFTTNAGQQADRHSKALSQEAIKAGADARAAFEDARDELAKL